MCAHSAELNLTNNAFEQEEASTPSSGDIKSNHKYSLSAPPSIPNFLMNASPSPEVIAHPEVIDMEHDGDNPMMQSLSKQEMDELETSNSTLHRDVKSELTNDCAENVAKTLVEDAIQNAILNTSIHQNYILDDCKLNTLTFAAKSTPVTISEFLGLESLDESTNSVYDDEDESLPTEIGPSLKRDDSLDPNAKEVCEPIDTMLENKDDGRLIGLNRADRLEQVLTLFNKIYTQVMIVDDPPIFYKQSNDGCARDTSDDIDFVSTESYNNIATYLKSLLPASLIGHNIDEYAGNDD